MKQHASAMERDLHGYGENPPRLTLPGKASVAVSLVVNFEEGGEWSIADGDSIGEKMAEVHSVVPPDRWDQGIEQQFAYGMRAGIWRVLGALAEHRRLATFYMCGQAVQRSPEIARRIVEAGHEGACHGWRWRTHADYDNEDAERRDLAASTAAIERATGVKPMGFFCRGSESVWTRRLLREAGYVYTSNGLDDDLPYWDEADRGVSAASSLLVLPYAFDSNDMKFFHPNGFVRADDFVDYVRDGLDVLIGEGRNGYPKLLNIGLHLRIIGRPGRFAALQRILRLLDDYGEAVCTVRRIDLAQMWSAQHPCR